MRNRARRALLAGLVLLPALAIASPARADVGQRLERDRRRRAAGAGYRRTPRRRPGRHLRRAPGDGPRRRLRRGQRDRRAATSRTSSSPAARAWYSQDAAVAAAACHVLLNGGSGPAAHAAARPAIEAAYQDTLAAIPARAGARRAGSPPAWPPRPRCSRRAPATAASRAHRSRFPIGDACRAQWRPVLPGVANDPAAWLKDVRPFVLARPGPRSVAGKPHPLHDAGPTRDDFDEVKAIGAATARRCGPPTRPTRRSYWGLTNAPQTVAPRRCSSVGRTRRAARRRTTRACSRMLYTTAADAAIVTWRGKAPLRCSGGRSPRIREAAADGNAAHGAGRRPGRR